MSLPLPALPTDRFSAFVDFIAEKEWPEGGWPCGDLQTWGDPQPWKLVVAAQVAASVAHALGAFSVEAESPAAAELRALAWLLSLFDTPESLAESRRAILLAGKLDQQPAGFALDNPSFGLDRGAWALMDGEQVRRLNTWCRHALTAFYAACPVDDAPDPAQLSFTLSLEEELLSLETPAEARPEAPSDPPAPASITDARWGMIWPLYIKHVEDVQAKHQRPPIIREDLLWAPAAGLAREELRAVRRAWRKKFF